MSRQSNIKIQSPPDMLKRFIESLILIALFLFAASWFYKVVFLLLLASVWRKNIQELGLWCYRVVVGVLLIALFCTLPRYRLHTSDRVKLVYQTEDAQPRHAPICQYLVNVLFPEEGIVNLGVWGVRILGKDLTVKAVDWVFGKPSTTKTFDWVTEEFYMEVARGNVRKMTEPYRRLNLSGDFPMSGVYSQLANMAIENSPAANKLALKETRAVYLIKPKNYDASKSYPVVFFMHGWLGNWKLYQGILKGMENCIVVSVGTKDWSGIYDRWDLDELFEKQIPFLRNMGYKVDTNNLHLIGLSNGGSASNLACKNYSQRFKSITFLSANIPQTYRISSKVLLVGGGLDHSNGVKDFPVKCQKLKDRGTEADMYWREDGTHFIFIMEQGGILEFLNKNIY